MNSTIDDSTLEYVARHDTVVAETRSAVAAEIRKLGSECDDNVRAVNGHYVGMYVLPSGDHLHVGFGPAGGKLAFRGDRLAFDAHLAAKTIVASLPT